MTVIYKPFGIIVGLLSGLVAKKVFDFIWARFDDEEPPKATTEYAPLPKILGAAALQGVVFKTTRAIADRHAAKGFSYLTGSWPGEKHQEKAGLG